MIKRLEDLRSNQQSSLDAKKEHEQKNLRALRYLFDVNDDNVAWNPGRVGRVCRNKRACDRHDSALDIYVKHTMVSRIPDVIPKFLRDEARGGQEEERKEMSSQRSGSRQKR